MSRDNIIQRVRMNFANGMSSFKLDWDEPERNKRPSNNSTDIGNDIDITRRISTKSFVPA